jgi:flagellar biosynthesis chaperone FliJ
MRIASLELMQKKLQSRVVIKTSRKEQKQTDEFAATKKITIFNAVY